MIGSTQDRSAAAGGLGPALGAVRARLGLVALLFVVATMAWWSAVDRMRGMDAGPGTRLGVRLTLPGEVNSESCAANLENGVLRLRLPKVSTSTRQRIPVQGACSAWASMSRVDALPMPFKSSSICRARAPGS